MLEVSFLDANLSVSRWEKQIYGLWFITVVLVVSNRLLSFEWNIYADSWASKRAVSILLLSNLVSTVGFHRLTKIAVWLHFTRLWLTSDAFSCIPVHVLLD